MKTINPRLTPRLRDSSYLHLKDLRDAVARIAPEAKGIVIDYGAGAKPYAGLFTSCVQYIGIDFYAYGPDDILIVDPKRIPVGDAFADWLVSFQVLEHVEEPSEFLRECFRALRSRGSLLLTTHGSWPHHPGEKYGDFYRWTGDGLRLLMKNAGFGNITLEPITTGLRSLMQQALVLRDPYRHSRGRLRRWIKSTANLCVNSVAEAIDPVMQGYNRRADIQPIAYSVRAQKP